jgi:hypothetical protein
MMTETEIAEMLTRFLARAPTEHEIAAAMAFLPGQPGKSTQPTDIARLLGWMVVRTDRNHNVMPPDPPKRWPMTDREFFDDICRSLPQCEPWELVEMLIAADPPDHKT